jgi:glycosyltransferase involved in cell wall biosynthesis
VHHPAALVTVTCDDRPASRRSTRSVPKIVLVGPGLGVRGGVSAVERLIIDSISGHVQVEHIATMEDGGILRRIRVFGAALWRIHSILRDESPCIFHVHFASRGSTLRKCIVSMMVLRTPCWLVLHAHGAGFDGFFSNLPRPLQERVARIFRRSHGFVVLSTQWLEFYATQLTLRRERIQIMVNPTDPPSTVPDRRCHDTVQFLFLGRIDDRKGAFELLDAYYALPATTRARARIVFAGDGRVGELRRRAAAIGPDVVVHSWLDHEERDHLLAASDVLVLPSHHEGVPMAILEAMAYGLPVIATPVGGIPDVIRHGREGLLVEVGNRAALTTALARMVAEPALRMSLGRGARATAESLDVTNYGQRLLEFYQTIIAGTSDASGPTEVGAETRPVAHRP